MCIQGMKSFREKETDAIIKKLKQLHTRQAVQEQHDTGRTKNNILPNFVKRGCAGGRSKLQYASAEKNKLAHCK